MFFHAIVCCSIVLPIGLCSVVNNDNIFLYACTVLGSSSLVGYCISYQSLGLPLSEVFEFINNIFITAS